MGKKSLQLQQLDSKILTYNALKRSAPPATGWVKAIRTALGMSMEQLGRRLSVTKQSILELEAREKDGSITLKALGEAAKALDMQLVYCIVPIDGSLEALIDRKSRELAAQIVQRTNATMTLEDQQNSQQRIEKAILERAAAIQNEMPKSLWD
jgi:predicted DNA-binding mobile mystery protein A